MAASNVFLMVFLMICPSFQLQGQMNEPAASSYLITDAPGIGCDEQNGVPVSMGKIQRHPLAHGLPMPQVPPQVVKPFVLLRNCRAETVPEHKTPITSTAKKVDLILFFMIFSWVKTEPFLWLHDRSYLDGHVRRYFPGDTTPAGRVVQNAVNGVVKEQKQPLAQGLVALQVPPHVVLP